MAGPGEYVPDITEGITSVDDLPKAKIKQRSRKPKKQLSLPKNSSAHNSAPI